MVICNIIILRLRTEKIYIVRYNLIPYPFGQSPPHKLRSTKILLFKAILTEPEMHCDAEQWDPIGQGITFRLRKH